MALKVYISYSPKDVQIKKELERFLASASDVLEILPNELLGAKGQAVGEELHLMRAQAEVFILLVSVAYINLTKTRSPELAEIMERARADRTPIIPVILEECDWAEEPYSTYIALPTSGVPLKSLSSKQTAYAEILDALLSLEGNKPNQRVVEIIAKEMTDKSGYLFLNNCNLRSIPRDLLDMPWLKYLLLRGNSIKKIENLEKLENLVELILDDNAISRIANLDRLKKLQSLSLSGNKLTQVSSLKYNVNLRRLDVSFNTISNLSGIAHLTKLESLFLEYNEIRDISVLAELTELKTIVLTGCQIQSIEPLLNHIKKGMNVELEYNYEDNKMGLFIGDIDSLSEPSLEVIEKGKDAILKYFADAATYGTRRLQIAKLILVGNSKVGKTNLSQFLRGVPFTPGHTSTHLLDIQNWDTPLFSSDPAVTMRINIFDFGGQDYYHDAHRIYYSHDTAYILLWDTTTNKYSEEKETSPDNDDLIYENFPVEYWLESISYNLASKRRPSYADEKKERIAASKPANTTPILVLQNKIDLQEGRLNQAVLCEKYQNISGFFNISLMVGSRTKVLYEVLQEYLKDVSGRTLIEYEYKIVEDYLNKPRQFKALSLGEFLKECVEIIDDEDTDFNESNAQIIAEILNAIGVIFYDKQTETEGIIFTQIGKLNEIIKDIMRIAKSGNEKGIFQLQQVNNIPYKNEVIELLVKNNSIIPLNDSEFLVPQFLPVKPEPTIQFFLHAFTYNQVRYIYKAYFHKSLLLSLFSKYLSGTLAGTSAAVQDLPFWRNGIIISRGEGASKQMVFIEFEKKETEGIINIKTMRPYNKNGLEREVENTLDLLNKGWTVNKEISVNSTDFFDLDFLRKETANLRFEFSANGKIFTINDFKHISDFEKLPKRLFISYSSKNTEFTRRFITHLEVLKSAGQIDVWYDRMIESGTKWDNTIRNELNNSDVIVFLLSPDFLATEYIMKTELPVAIEQMQNEKSKFFFIELQPCGWKRTIIATFQQTDDPNIPHKNIIHIGQPDNDGQWNKVIDELVDKLERK